MNRLVTGSNAGTPLATKFSFITEANDQRARHASHDNTFRVFGIDDQERVGAFEALHRLTDRSRRRSMPCLTKSWTRCAATSVSVSESNS